MATKKKAANTGNNRTKIAVLGGGMGSLAAVFALTDRPGWRERYDITVYQLGWRLGGKGASGRNLAAGARIEEHGLHVWLGFYENAFRMMQRCYKELGRPAGALLARWEEAFKPHSYTVTEEHVDGSWSHWPVEFPTNDEVPGHGGVWLKPWDYVVLLLRWAVEIFKEWPANNADGERLREDEKPPWWESILQTTEGVLRGAELDVVGLLLELAVALVDRMERDAGQHYRVQHDAIVWMLQRFLQWLWGRVATLIEHDVGARRLWIAIDLISATARGMIVDEVVVRGFDHIDDYEFKDWLRKHGASELTLNSAWVRGAYDLVFGFRQGHWRQKSLAAGTGLRGGLRMMLGYKGALMWKMQAGMGDVVFAPFYEVLRRRGVKFEFFHRVRHLHLSADKRSVERITLGRQATPKGQGYNPFVSVHGLPCWPSTPVYSRIKEGKALAAFMQRDPYQNLESAWTAWKDVAEVSLRKGDEFDLVILGISIAGLPATCAELIEARKEWRDMIAHVQTTRTQSVQLWLKPSLAHLGWHLPSPVLGGYVEPLSTWADMSHLIPAENWPTKATPGNIAYFCGPLEDSKPEPPFTNSGFPRTQVTKVKKTAQGFLEHDAHYLWPRTAPAPHPDRFNWELLVDAADSRGGARFDAQFFRANIDPSERYVLSVPGSMRYRLTAGGSGFDNLYLAGDWLRTGLNSGCIESAVMSGLQAARAIAGYPKTIIGESDF